jgi:hypothetical protein
MALPGHRLAGMIAPLRTPAIFLAYAPRGVGLRCLVAYLTWNRDAYGWFTGPREDGTLASEYFLLENFYSTGPMRYAASSPEDLHSGWLDEARCHELARTQDAVAHEWLFHRDDPGAKAALEAYARDELAIGEVNIRHDRLGKLYKLHPNWTYYSTAFERPVLKCLAGRWPLEYRSEEFDLAY